jgi:hypothetical protein
MSGIGTMQSVRFDVSSTRRHHETDGSIARTTDDEVRGALFAATGARADTRAGSGDTAQAKCFDSKIMARPSVFTENSFKFSDQNNVRARYWVFRYARFAAGKIALTDISQVTLRCEALARFCGRFQL